MFLGPYLSGCRWARTAPVTMIVTNRAVMIPVIAYKMIIVVAVEGAGPLTLEPEEEVVELLPEEASCLAA